MSHSRYATVTASIREKLDHFNEFNCSHQENQALSGLRPGQLLDVRVEGGRITLTPRRIRSRKTGILIDPITGLPMLSAGPDAPVLTSEQVNEILLGKL
jgi:hypothetical protein